MTTVTFRPFSSCEWKREVLDFGHARELSRAIAPTGDLHVCYMAYDRETGESDDCRDLHQPSLT